MFVVSLFEMCLFNLSLLSCSAIIKPQYVDSIPKMLKGKPGACDKLLNAKNDRDQLKEVTLELNCDCIVIRFD
jgi:translation initiation factor RLI1